LKSPRDVIRETKVFITSMLIIGPIIGVISALGYRWVVTTYGTWDTSKDTFHFGIILYGLGFTFPILSISVRLMTKMFFLTCEQLESQNFILETLRIAHDKAPTIIKNVEEVVDKSVPIARTVEEIVTRAKGMAEDVEKIAHRIRTATDAINGGLDFKAIEGKLEKVAENLNMIASVFAPVRKNTGNSIAIPEFDPLKAGGKRG
jgi:hypothetical protein